jgi:hypothetical protein
MTASALNDRIDQLFGSRPRDGNQKGALWHRRAKIETRLSQLISARSQSICIDGPTGSGKSSLAITVFSKINQRYIWIPIVNNMMWPDFCEENRDQIVQPSSRVEEAQSAIYVCSLGLE